jgi:hypothetical protein
MVASIKTLRRGLAKVLVYSGLALTVSTVPIGVVVMMALWHYPSVRVIGWAIGSSACCALVGTLSLAAGLLCDHR